MEYPAVAPDTDIKEGVVACTILRTGKGVTPVLFAEDKVYFSNNSWFLSLSAKISCSS